MTSQQKRKFFSEIRHYFWEDPYLFRMCADGMIRRCVAGAETREILDACHHGPTGGHYGPSVTSKKAVDYVYKWDEAKALPTNDAKVIDFLKKLFSRFGIPKALISDRGTHFANHQLAKVLKRYRVTHRFSTSYHPQTSDQVENTNKALKRILEKTVHDNPKIWAKRLDDALFLQLHELDEMRLQAYDNSMLYKECTKAWHDSKIKRKEFKVGDKVLLFQSKYKLKAPKLKSRWIGPYVVKKSYSSRYMELIGNDETFIVNGHRLKHYYEENEENAEVFKIGFYAINK
uniref:uncharacterized protein LOC122597086 n=1 Tax=Erigeron canadensis TaxID=72917 RepID=UPI001CB8C675|nr:uncharacterized protein LOC122597086 [Erigeron canadensis]